MIISTLLFAAESFQAPVCTAALSLLVSVQLMKLSTQSGHMMASRVFLGRNFQMSGQEQQQKEGSCGDWGARTGR